MINGDVSEFAEGIHSGSEMVFLCDGKKYFIRGWLEIRNEAVTSVLCLVTWEPPSDDYLRFESGPDSDVLAEHFIAAPVFEGKTFWEVEREIEWVDA